MLTRGDDYPIHQTADPIAYAGSNRNFYDRYFFNGYDRDGEVYFAAALGVYPNLDVMDSSFSVVFRGTQYCLFASKALGMERMDTRVGPIEVEVLEPLKTLRIRVGENEHGIRADLTFHHRARVVEEPRFFRRVGPRPFLDYTRLTQHGSYEGWLEIDGERIEVERTRVMGTRDRSWGIRPVGERDYMGGIQVVPQFFWLWAPINFEDRVVLFDSNQEADGTPWHEHGAISELGDVEPEVMSHVRHRLELQSGTRHARRAEIFLTAKDGTEHRIELEPIIPFYMKGIGYTHPEWGHGTYRGELVVGGERFATKEVDPRLPQHVHIQALCRATMGERKGTGILEQLIFGPHAPSGLNDILDMAP
jgi:hypothetical protein